MSSTTKKHANFVAEPMGEKSVSELPGIGAVLGKRLAAAGYDKANTVLGKYLILHKDQKRFTDWIKSESSANSKQALDCYQCLDEWCKNLL